jgi:hypothetical protein
MSGQGIYVTLNLVNLDPNCAVSGISSSFISLPDSSESGSINFQMAGALNVYSAIIPSTAEAVTIGVCAAQDPICGGSYACTEVIVYANTSNVILLDFGMSADNDGDGYTAETDCDDTMASVNPGAQEICDDFLDNNCNGEFNEGCGGGPIDLDLDGFASSLDCNDMDATVNPGMPELCADNIDNNCNGVVDEEGCVGNPFDCNPEILLITDSTSFSNEPGIVWILNNFMDPSGSFTYSWDFGDGNMSTDAFPTNIYDLAGTYTICLTVTGNGCTGTTCITFTVTPEGDFLPGGMPMTGFTLNVVSAIPNNVANTIANAALEVYPNPIGEQSTIRWSGMPNEQGSMEIISMEGRVVYSTAIASLAGARSVQLPYSELAGGVYTVRLRSASGFSKTIQLIK